VLGHLQEVAVRRSFHSSCPQNWETCRQPCRVNLGWTSGMGSCIDSCTSQHSWCFPEICIWGCRPHSSLSFHQLPIPWPHMVQRAKGRIWWWRPQSTPGKILKAASSPWSLWGCSWGTPVRERWPQSDTADQPWTARRWRGLPLSGLHSRPFRSSALHNTSTESTLVGVSITRLGKLVNKLSHAFLHAFFPCQRSAGREEEKTERAGMGFGPVGAGGHCGEQWRTPWRPLCWSVAVDLGSPFQIRWSRFIIRRGGTWIYHWRSLIEEIGRMRGATLMLQWWIVSILLFI